MANYTSRHTGTEIDDAIDQVAEVASKVEQKIDKPESALTDQVLAYNGTTWVNSDRSTVVKTWTAADIT